MNLHSSTCLSKKVSYNILENLGVNLTIQENPYQIPLDDLFTMAARVNKKRSFLFVSKVLGKHIPIRPEKAFLTGTLLAARYMETVKKDSVPIQKELLANFMNDKGFQEIRPFIQEKFNPIIIGFAETATALGHAFFDVFPRADFFHTTREYISHAPPTITFEEEHSHATSHRAYIDECLLENTREIILVDDEMTTGKTALNIIRSIHEKYPRKTYTVVSILDWRSEENLQMFEKVQKDLYIDIKVVSLLKGTVNVEGEALEAQSLSQANKYNIKSSQKINFWYIDNPSPFPYMSIDSKNKQVNEIPYLKWTGRFGIDAKTNRQSSKWIQKTGEELGLLRSGKKTLCVGTGEFMYIPMKMSLYMGEGVYFQSTTRSPIYPFRKSDYGAKNRFTFSNPENQSVENYLYNINENQYDELFIFFERDIDRDKLSCMFRALEKTNIREIKIIIFSRKAGEGDE